MDTNHSRFSYPLCMSVQVTAEGDFIVLLLQTARFLISCCRDAREGKPLSGLASYLQPLQKPGDCPPASVLPIVSQPVSPRSHLICFPWTLFLVFPPCLCLCCRLLPLSLSLSCCVYALFSHLCILCLSPLQLFQPKQKPHASLAPPRAPPRAFSPYPLCSPCFVAGRSSL